MFVVGYHPNYSVFNAVHALHTQDDCEHSDDARAYLAEALCKSGIRYEGGDFSWLADRRIIEALFFAHYLHDGKRRKIGGLHRVVHEIRCAHRVFNSDILRAWIKQNEYDPMLGAFCAIAHDTVENSRTCTGMLIHPSQIKARLFWIWDNPHEFNTVVLPELRYMTDEDPTLAKGPRIQAQKNKGYTQFGAFNLGLLSQSLRFHDKLDHIDSDLAAIKREITRRKRQGWSANNGDLLQMLEKSVRGAIAKSYVLEFPDIPKTAKQNYVAALNGLRITAREIARREKMDQVMRIPASALLQHSLRSLTERFFNDQSEHPGCRKAASPQVCQV